MSSYYIESLEIQNENMPTISLGDLSAHLNIIYGPNESGKSRIKEFLEWMMFAQSQQFNELTHHAKRNAFDSINDGIKGRVQLTNAFSKATLIQNLANNKIESTVLDSNMRLEDILHLLNDGITLDHYRNVFSLNLQALSELASNRLLSEDQTAEVFLSAAQTGSGVSLSSLVSELKDKKEELFSSSGNATKREVNRLIKELNDLEKEIRQIRRDQKTSLSFTSELEALNRTNEDLKSELSRINESLSEIQLTRNYAQTFEQYNELIQAAPILADTEIVGEIVSIKELLNQCEHHSGDETLLNQLLSEKAKLESELEEARNILSETIEPEKVSAEVNSHEFRTALEVEKQSLAQFNTDHSRLQENFDNENAQLISLNKRIEELQEQKDQLENKQKPDSKKPTLATETKKGNTKKNLISLVGIATSVALFIASVITGQPIGMVSAIALLVFSVLIRLNKTDRNMGQTETSNIAIESIEMSGISREMDSTYSQLKQKQAIIATIVKNLSDIENARTQAHRKYTETISQVGFSSSLDTIHIGLFLDDFENYKQKKSRYEEVSSRTEALSNWFEKFFDSVALLQNKTSSAPISYNSQITTISQAKTWLESLLEYANKNKELEKQLHERESETRTLEKSIVAQFSSIEKAKEHFLNHPTSEVKTKLETLNEKKNEIEDKISTIDQKIGSIKQSAEHAGKDTQLQDFLTKKQSLIEELNEAHTKYLLAYCAHTQSEKAFAKCQRDSQPEVLQKASRFFQIATSSKWNTINIDLADSNKSASNKIHMSVSNGINSLDVTKLSQGAKEQLYLSLRLALIESTSRAKHVPVMFDDISVNSDAKRFSQISPLISELAKSRQVFYFTCHEWVSKELSRFENTKIHYL